MGTKERNEEISPLRKFETFVKSIRNITETKFMLIPNISGYDIIRNRDLIVMDSALDQLKVLLGGQQ